MAGENAQMDSFLQNAGDPEAQAEAEADTGTEDLAVGEQDVPEEKPAEADTGAEEKGAEEKAGERPPNYVPIQALDEARGQHKETQELLRQAQGTINTMNERFSEFVTHVRGGEKEGAPSLEDEPVDNLDSRLKALEGYAETYGQQQQHQTQQQQVAQQLQQAGSQIQAAEAQFQSNTPDYAQAVQYVQNLFAKDLALRGVEPMAAAGQVRQEMGMAAVQVLVSGQDPAAVLYERAKALGYQPAAGGQETMEDKAAQLKAVAGGQAANRSLSDGGGRSPGQPNSLEELAELPDAEIDKNWDRIIGRAGPTFGGLLK